MKSDLGETIAAVAAAGAFLTVADDIAARIYSKVSEADPETGGEIAGLRTVIAHAQKLLTGNLWDYSARRKTKPAS